MQNFFSWRDKKGSVMSEESESNPYLKDIEKILESLKNAGNDDQIRSIYIGELVKKMVSDEELIEKVGDDKLLLIHFSCGVGNLELGKFPNALEHFNKVLLLGKNENKILMETYFKLHEIHILMKNFPESCKALQSGLEVEPKNKKFMKQLGKLLRIMKKNEEARSVYKKLMELHPDCTESKLDYGVLLVTENQYDEALKIFDELAKEGDESNKITSLYYCGLCYENLNQVDEAVVVYEKILSEKSDVDTLCRIVPIYENKNELEKVKTSIELLTKVRGERYPLLQKFKRCEFKVPEGKKVIGFQFFELTKTFVGWGSMQGKLIYVFYIINPTVEKIEGRISLGSYDSTNMFMSMQRHGAGGRMYHLDGYFPGTHKTYGFYSDGLPDWFEIKERVKGILSENVTNISSTKREGGKNVITIGK